MSCISLNASGTRFARVGDNHRCAKLQAAATAANKLNALSLVTKMAR